MLVEGCNHQKETEVYNYPNKDPKKRDEEICRTGNKMF